MMVDGGIKLMDKQLIEKKISEVFIKTIQDMAFIDMIRSDKENQAHQGAQRFRIEVLMPYCGDFVIIFDQGLAEEFALNVFGPQTFKELENPIADATSEFLNVLIGRIINVLSPEMLFELGLPQVFSETEHLGEYSGQKFISPENKLASFYFKPERLMSAFH